MPQIITSTLPNGFVGDPYNAALIVASGGASTIYGNWTIVPGSGALPNGLSLNASTGVISGTPSASDANVTFPFSVTVQDSAGNTSLPQPLSIAILPGVTVTTRSLPNGTVGVLYSYTLAAGGGVAPYGNWAVVPGSGALPQGLTLSPSTGLIYGTPTTPGQFSFSVTIQDSDGGTSPPQPLSITILPGVTVTTSSLPNGTVGVLYNSTLTASGGVSPYSHWTVAAGTLPGGLTLIPSTGVISGTPSVSGQFSFSVTVQDSAANSSPPKPLSITIVPGLTVITRSLPNGAVDVSYNSTLAAGGGVSPYSNWTVVSGALPGGLTLTSSTGVISGTPSATGQFSFSVTVQDNVGDTSPAQPLSIAITPPPLIISTSSLQVGTVNTAYNQPLVATGGIIPYTWSIGGNVPAGLSVTNGPNGNSAIIGMPTAAGTFSVTLTVTDSSNPKLSNSTSLPLTIKVQPLVITPNVLTSGIVGVLYSQNLTVTGGNPPYSLPSPPTGLPAWAAASISNGATGGTIAIIGTPTAAGTSALTLTVTDSSTPQLSLTAYYNLKVTAPPLQITPGLTLTALTGVANSYAVNVTLDSPAPEDLTATLTLSFAGTAAVPLGNYPGVSFASGSTTTPPILTTTLVISSGSTSAPLPAAIQAGSVEGTITVTLTELTGNGQALALPANPSTTIAVPALPPVITGVKIINVMSTGFTVDIVASSSTLDLTGVTLTFTPAPGGTLTGTSFSYPGSQISDPASKWFTSNAQTYGGAFDLQIPFTFSGDTSAIGSVTVTLTNSVPGSGTGYGSPQ